VWPHVICLAGVKSAPPFWLFIDANKVTRQWLHGQPTGEVRCRAQNTVRLGGLVGGTPAAGDQAYCYPLFGEEQRKPSFQLENSK